LSSGNTFPAPNLARIETARVNTLLFRILATVVLAGLVLAAICAIWALNPRVNPERFINLTGVAVTPLFYLHMVPSSSRWRRWLPFLPLNRLETSAAEYLRQLEALDGEGLGILTEEQTRADKTGERAYEAELHRIKGELLLRQAVPDEEQAEACFQKALEVARGQQAKSLELRAAMSLSRLWQRQDKRVEARKLLADIYSWFTEGFGTADLKAAKALLEELS